MRSGVPGLHHDWIWPATRHEFWLRFIQDLSTWSPYGFGADTDAPGFNAVSTVLWLLAATGLGSRAVLAIFLTGVFAAGQIGILWLFETIGARIGIADEMVLAVAYAFSPVCFEKFAAGQLYYIVAYELLPIFLALLWISLCSRDQWWRAAVGAGLVLTVMESQIQFLGFCTIIAIIVALSFGARARDVVARLGIIIGVALIRDVPMLANFRANESLGLIAQHATLVWEHDLSGQLGDLFFLGGYIDYDAAALPGRLFTTYAIARVVVVLLAVAGVVIGLLQPRFRRATVVALVIGAVGLLWGLGLNGPFGPVFVWMLHATPLFTIVREFYHGMALYALAVVLLCSIALAALRAVWLRVVLVALAGTVLPFVYAANVIPSTGLGGSAERDCSAVSNLCVLFPTQSPIGFKAQRLYGVDPATLVANSANGSSMPPFFEYAIDRFANGDTEPLAQLGVQSVMDRPELVSRLPEVFEPHVGATFGSFDRRQMKIERILAARSLPLLAVPETYVEERGAVGALDREIADAQLPPGRAGAFTYSYVNNDVNKSWVSGRLWAWRFPALMSTASEPVVTRSDSGLPVMIAGKHGTWCYVLAAALAMTLDDKPPSAAFEASGVYRWYLWPVDADANHVVLRAFGGDRAVARVIFSRAPRWRPGHVPPASSNAPTAVSSAASVPWEIAVKLPVFQRPMDLVFARAYSPQWHLVIDGKDQGAAQRVHGLFNGWELTGADSGKNIRLIHTGQAFVSFVNALVLIVDAVLLVLACLLRRRATT